MRTTGMAVPVAEWLESIRAIDRSVATPRIDRLDELMSISTETERYYSLLLGLFATTAVALAAIGIYGVVTTAVQQRTFEIGIRMAAGASEASVLRLIVMQGMTPVLIGVALGLIAAHALSRFLSAMLFGVSSTDLRTFVAVTLVLLVVAFVTMYAPARRAARMNPSMSLRY